MIKEITLIKGYKYRIYPTEDQKQYLAKVFGCCRYTYNKLLADNIKAYEAYKKDNTLPKPDLNKFTLINQVAKIKRMPECNWLSEAPSQVLQACAMNLASAFGNFFRTKKGYPRFKSRNNHQSAKYSNISFSIKNDQLKLAKCDKLFKVVWSRSLPSAPISASISKTPTGKYYVSFQCYYEPTKTSGTGIVGIDAGITDIVTFSDGTAITNPRHFIKSQKRLARYQRAHSRKQKGSKNRNKARLKVAKIHEKIANQRNDFIHKLSTKCVSENQAICIETLMVKNMSKNRKLSKHIMDAGWSTFREHLKYKCTASMHCKLFLADPYFPSTQICHACGTKPKEKLKLGTRRWTCLNCNTTHQRDHNAAKNLELNARREMARLSAFTDSIYVIDLH